jgi:hypothetical protein
MQESRLSFKRIAEYGKEVDFGKAASDYGRYRAGYPDELYRRLKRLESGSRARDCWTWPRERAFSVAASRTMA